MKENYSTEVESLPIFLSDNFFVFPSCTEILKLENDDLLKKILADSWKYHGGRLLVISSRFPISFEDRTFYDPKKFFNYGTLVRVEVDFSKDVDINVIFNYFREVQITGIDRVRIDNVRKYQNEEFYCADYQVFRDESSPFSAFNKNKQQKSGNTEAIKKLTTLLSGLLQKTNSSTPYLVFSSMDDIGNVIDFFVQGNKGFTRDFKQSMIEEYKIEERLKILTELDKEIRRSERDTKEKTNEKIIKQQTSAYLREQLSFIQSQIHELEGIKSEKEVILKRLENENFPNHVKETVLNELDNYEKMNPNFPEAGVIRNYIDWIMSLPWYQISENVDSKSTIKELKEKLDKNHHGLEKVKEKIVEYFALLQNVRSELSSSIENENE